MTGGLRERKKRLTRRRIADVALGLFVERGFDHVTITEVAEKADVSVNTVYNYFATKEDLVLPPGEASPDRLADMVRGRAAGESAAVAVLGRLREEVRRRDRAVGLTEGFGRVLAMMLAAPTLAARLEDVSGQMVRNLAEVLAEETGAREDDPVPGLVAGQIGWFHGVVFGEIGKRTVAGEDPELIAAAALTLLDEIEALLGERVLTYAVREEEDR
ncbi:TetR/AcrR family transcriptional regulator [Amycolatopsis sp. YIM 10]|uniref:TetR/AcrR family transcriptional regulator n=1 Tax=Amycolatopsis sp. YIM 10 TaxID=2653857 RepID=UPI0012904430|nr:TetR/AcrR family transcriptional regulator [Amycolatopsis sp. YIM 10]QFU89164.1 Transcriptional regulator, TetR family [Amycolatopsis sp. YIM 10]